MAGVTPKPAQSARKRRRMTEDDLIAVVESAAQDGSWNAAAWLLERRWPDRYSKSRGPIAPEATPLDEPESGPDPFAEVVDLARKRRSR